MSEVVPSEEELLSVIAEIKKGEPELGIKKVLAAVTAQQPTWAVSEKRVKKLMQSLGLVRSTHLLKSGVEDDPSVPVSFIDPKLDLKATSTAIEARMVDRITGKGLFAARDLNKDEIIFEETPFIFFPVWDLYNEARIGNVCALCTKPFKKVSHSVLSVRCQHCDVSYCSAGCRKTAWESFHKLECTHLNPAMSNYINMCSSEQWAAAMAVARIYCHLILANDRGDLDAVLAHYDAFATVNQIERQAKETAWIFMEHNTRELWTKARKLLSKALNPPPKKCKITNPLPEEFAKKLFDDEDTFLEYLGKYNINNQNGGLYLVQSHMNHECHPNVCIEHPVRLSDYKISVRAIRDIKKGEQLFETYVNPRWNKETRTNYLSTNYMFTCNCNRCKTDGPVTEELRLGLRLRPE